MKTNTLLETGTGGCVWLGGIVEICDAALTWATFEPQTLGEEGQRGWLGCVCQLVLTLPVTVYIDGKVGAPRLGYAQLRSNFDSLNVREVSISRSNNSIISNSSGGSSSNPAEKYLYNS